MPVRTAVVPSLDAEILMCFIIRFFACVSKTTRMSLGLEKRRDTELIDVGP